MLCYCYVMLHCHDLFCVTDYGINSILYQRGIYPPETFTHEQQFGLTLLVTTNDVLIKYLETVIGQVKSKTTI